MSLIDAIAGRGLHSALPGLHLGGPSRLTSPKTEVAPRRRRGLPAVRSAWIADRGDSEHYQGRAHQALDDGMADMYPPERRARGIALVLFGAVFGALLGPFVFVPLFANEGAQGVEQDDKLPSNSGGGWKEPAATP